MKAETLKYFYLLFSPNDFLPLDSIVINTEAHIFPRFELQKNLQTGWTRKPRDKFGHIIGKKIDSIPKEPKDKEAQNEDEQRIKEAAEQRSKTKGKQLHPEGRSDVQESSQKDTKDTKDISGIKRGRIGVKTQMTTVTRAVTSTVVVDVEKATYPAKVEEPKATDRVLRKPG